MKDTDNKATVWDDESEIQPEGGLNEDDIFGESEFDGDDLDKLFAEESAGEENEEDGAEEHNESETDGADDSAPTTETEEEAAEEDKEAETPTTEIEPTLPRKLTFSAKIDRKEQSVELDESDLPLVYQKAHNYDRVSAKLEKSKELNKAFTALAIQLGYESAQDMIEKASKANRDAKIEELMNGGAPKELAEDYVDRRIRNVHENAVLPNDDDEEEDEEVESTEKTEEESDQDDKAYFRDQVADFFKARPDLRGKITTLPEEVSKALILRQGTLRELYAEWETKQQKAEKEKVRKEKDIFAKQAEAASRAPVRGAPDTKADNGDKPDPLREAFRSDMSW